VFLIFLLPLAAQAADFIESVHAQGADIAKVSIKYKYTQFKLLQTGNVYLCRFKNRNVSL
jgi:hypothetical protein